MSRSCVNCGSEYVVNMKYQLCDSCNFIRLHGKSRFEYELERSKNKPSKAPKGRLIIKGKLKDERIGKRRETIRKDEETYYQVFISKPNKCEECGCDLPDIFRDEEGRVVCRFQYSHILGKQAFPEFRNKVKNFNRLCFNDHQRWEFHDKENMNIYASNQVIILELLNEQISSGSSR